VLQCVAMRCRVLQSVAVQCIAVQINILNSQLAPNLTMHNTYRADDYVYLCIYLYIRIQWDEAHEYNQEPSEDDSD